MGTSSWSAIPIVGLKGLRDRHELVTSEVAADHDVERYATAPHEDLCGRGPKADEDVRARAAQRPAVERDLLTQVAARDGAAGEVVKPMSPSSSGIRATVKLPMPCR